MSMTIRKLRELSEAEYDAYASKHEYANFLNSIYSGRKLAMTGWDIHYVGLQEDGVLCAAALLASVQLRGSYRYFYAPRGFLLDYENQEVLRAMSEGVRDFAKERGGLYLRIDPYVAYQQRDCNGDVVEGGFCRQNVVDALTSCGFLHQGFTVGYDDAVQCRWMSVLDLRGKTKEQLLKQMNSQTRQNVKNTIKTGIKVRPLAYEELDILHDIVNRTSERRGFFDLSLEYYQQQYRAFGEHAKAYYAYLDLDDYLTRIHADQQKEEETIRTAQAALQENPHSKNSRTRLQTAASHLEALAKRESEALALQKECGHEVPLAAAMFLFYGREIVYLASGSNEQYKKFKGPYAMQWHLIQMGVDQGYDFYNFYGISGYFEKEQDGYGVFDFKRGFRAEVVELVGDFLLPIQPKAYKSYLRMQKLKRMLRRS